MPRSKQANPKKHPALTQRHGGSKLTEVGARRLAAVTKAKAKDAPTGIQKPPRKPRKGSKGSAGIAEILKLRAGLGGPGNEKYATALLIPKLPFQRVVREIAVDYRSDIRFTPEALFALQDAVEDYVVRLFEDALVMAIHDKRVTVMVRDFVTVLQMWRRKLAQVPEWDVYRGCFV